MASWFSKLTPKLFPNEEKSVIPAGVWTQCSQCCEAVYSKEFDKFQRVCPSCGHHAPLDAQSRIACLFDKNSFREIDGDLTPVDVLNFADTKKYKDRLKTLKQRKKLKEAITTGRASIRGLPLVAAVFEFGFMGGSMGSVVGEKIARAAELGVKEKLPLLIVSRSGGARMQEGTFSLMQMAKTAAAVKRLKNAGVPFISLLTYPTTGGVTASFAMLGDLIVAEPNAMIGFAGQRVIRETIKQELPPGFQTSEFLLSHGSIDRVIHRHELRKELSELFTYMSVNNPRIPKSRTAAIPAS